MQAKSARRSNACILLEISTARSLMRFASCSFVSGSSFSLTKGISTKSNRRLLAACLASKCLIRRSPHSRVHAMCSTSTARRAFAQACGIPDVIFAEAYPQIAILRVLGRPRIWRRQGMGEHDGGPLPMSFGWCRATSRTTAVIRRVSLRHSSASGNPSL